MLMGEGSGGPARRKTAKLPEVGPCVNPNRWAVGMGSGCAVGQLSKESLG